MLIAQEAQNMHQSVKRISLTSHKRQTVTPKSFAYHHMKTLLVKFFNSTVPLSAGVESIFLLGVIIKTSFAQRG